MAVDGTPIPPPPQAARRGGCGRRGCIVGCVLAFLACLVLGVVIWIGVLTATRYVQSLPPEAAPCTMMQVWLRLVEPSLNNPQVSARDAAEMRRTYEQIKAEYDRRCSPSSSRLF